MLLSPRGAPGLLEDSANIHSSAIFPPSELIISGRQGRHTGWHEEQLQENHIPSEKIMTSLQGEKLAAHC